VPGGSRADRNHTFKLREGFKENNLAEFGTFSQHRMTPSLSSKVYKKFIALFDSTAFETNLKIKSRGKTLQDLQTLSGLFLHFPSSLVVSKPRALYFCVGGVGEGVVRGTIFYCLT